MLTTRYGISSPWRISSSIASSRSCSAARLARLDEREHLDLVELVHAEDAARVLARGARLAPEAGREAGVAARHPSMISPACSDASGTSEVPARNSGSSARR